MPTLRGIVKISYVMFVEFATQGWHAGCAQKTLAVIAVTAREGKRVSRPLGCCPGSDSRPQS